MLSSMTINTLKRIEIINTKSKYFPAGVSVPNIMTLIFDLKLLNLYTF